MPYGENGLFYPDQPPPSWVGGGGGGASGGTGVPEPYYAPPTEGEWFNPFYGPPVVPAGGDAPPPSPGPTPDPSPPQPPPIGFDPTPAPGVDTWIGAGGGFFGGVFNITKRSRRQYELLVRRGIRDIGKTAVDAWQRLQTGPRLKMAPGGPKPPGGLPVAYKEPLPPVPRVMVTPISLIVGAITGLIPGNLFRQGGLSPVLTTDERINELVKAKGAWLNQPGALIGLPEGIGTDPGPYRDPRRAPDLLLENLPPRIDTGFRAFLRREAAGLGNDYGPDWLRKQLGLPQIFSQRGQGPPEPERKQNIADISSARNVAPSPAPPAVTTPGQVVTQQTIPGAAPRAPRGRARQRAFQFGTLGTLFLLIEANRRNRGDPAPIGAPTIAPEPLSPSTPDPATPVLPIPQPLGSSSFYGGEAGGSAYCVPRPRGPRRKCLERAPVKYSGGRRKGAAAGTKCLRWEAPKR